MLSYIAFKTNRVINPAIPIQEGLRSYSRVMTFDQHNMKIFYLNNIKIYKEGIVKDPVHDYETLKLLYELDRNLVEGNKKEAISCYNKFVTNTDDTKYGDDFGKAKDHIDSIINSHRKTTKITPLDLLDSMGLKKKDLLDKGILETTLSKTKGNVGSIAFEILVMDALPGKYDFIEKVHYCQDGKLKYKSINFTGQTNPDYAIDIKDDKGNMIRIAYDSKAQKMDTFLTNLELKGLRYQVVTVGSTPDKFILSNDVFKKAIKSFDSEKIDIWNERYKLESNKVMMFMSTSELAEYMDNKKNGGN